MNQNRKLLALAFVFTFVWQSYCEDVKSDKLFMWKVTSPTTSAYLLGSIHAGRADFFPLAPEIENAFAESKALVLEIDIEKVDEPKLQMIAMQKGLYQGDDTLSKNVSKETMALVNAYCEKNPQLAILKEKFKPWYFGLNVAQLEMMRMGLSPELGIDKYFAKKAKGAKTVLELESMEFQLDLFSGFPKELDEKALAISLAELGTMKETLDEAIKHWKLGDPDAMNEHAILKPLRKHPESKPYSEKIFDERNVKMVEKIEGYLKTNDVHFVIAGAGHMVGDKGIVKLLQDKKYKIEQVKRKPAPK